MDDEVYDATNNTDPDALALRASADGDPPNQNLWLKETGDFTGVYEGFLRLTDADGIGDADDAMPTTTSATTGAWTTEPRLGQALMMRQLSALRADR